MDIEGIEDPSVLTAMHSLVNPETVDQKLDLEDIEKQLRGTITSVEEEPIDASEAFETMMKEFSKNIEPSTGQSSGTDLFFDTGTAPNDEVHFAPQPSATAQNSFTEMTPAPITQPNISSFNTSYAPPPTPVNKFDPSTADMKVGYPNPHEYPPAYETTNPYMSTRPRTELERMTEEQKDQRQIDYVLRKMDGGEAMSSSFDKEREKEDKIRMLDEIDAIRSEMKYEKIDISGIPEVTIDNSISEIENTLRILRFKYDRKRYNSLAEDVIMAGAYGAEWVFDGKRKFGPYSPDLTDWHNTVRVKLRRMRYETSTIVSNIMNEYQIGPVWRILLELVPSAFLHSRMRSRRNGENIPTEEEMQMAMGQIRDFE